MSAAAAPHCSWWQIRGSRRHTADRIVAGVEVLRNASPMEMDDNIEPRKRPEVLFGSIAAAIMLTYKYHVRGAKTILRYNFEEARKEREARKQREELAKTNIDISFC